MKKIIAIIKKVVAIVKKALGLVKTITPEQKKEAQAIVADVVKAVEEVKAKEPIAPKGNLVPLESAPAAPKKKKKYYKPKAKSNSL